MSEVFRVLGIFLAKLLQDGRLVDLPLSLSFLRLLTANSVTDDASECADNDDGGGSGSDETKAASNVALDGILDIADLDEVHAHKARFLRAVQRLCVEKAKLHANASLTHAERQRRIADLRLRFHADNEQHEHECRIEDLGLTFVVNPPSKVFAYDEYELISGGATTDVTLDNVELYLSKCVDFYLNSGIRAQVSGRGRSVRKRCKRWNACRSPLCAKASILCFRFARCAHFRRKNFK